MERPRLFEYPIYAAILGVTAAWVYALPPFAHDPTQPSTADAGPTAAAEANEPAEESTTLAGPGSQAQPRSLARQEGDAAEPANAADAPELNTERASLSDPDEAEPALDPKPNLLRVTANSLNMRAEPNAQSPRVASYPRGAVVEPVTTEGNWVLVRTVDDAATGWMYADYLDQVAEN